MSSHRLKIAFVGGGSTAWAPSILRDMMLTPSLADRCDFALLDVVQSRSDFVKKFAEKLAGEIGSRSTFSSTTDAKKALTGADYVIIAISTGGLDAMKHDIAIPEKFGIFHTVGDTVGPGGWARAIRNFGVFRDLGQLINRVAPKAIVLNYTNPMTCLTDVLARICGDRVVGLCHGLFENLEFIKRHYKLTSEDEIAVQYGGINHFFWMTHCRAGNIDVLADLKKKTKNRSLSVLLREVYSDPMGHHSDRELATELFRQTGALPYIGDRHTCECFQSYITSRATMARYKLKRTSIATRAGRYRKRARELQQMLASDRKLPDSFHQRSRETAADIIDAHANGRVFIDVGNVPNIGQIANLPRGLVVETAVRVDRNGFTPLTFGELPPAVLGFVQPFARVFPMTVDACFQADRDLAIQALRLDPLCAHLTGRQVEDLGGRLLAAHRKYIDCF